MFLVTRRNAVHASLFIGATLGLAACSTPTQAPLAERAPTRTIIFVWDGLRPDAVSEKETPNLWALRQRGTWFADNHSTYPTFTMMNATAFATGSFPRTTGFYGNTWWRPGASGRNMSGAAVDFQQPAYTEDFAVLQDLDESYGGELFLVRTLFQEAQAKGLATAVVGKSGAAFIQDRKRGGTILDENIASPQAFAVELQQAGYPLPKNTTNGHPPGAIALAANNGDPTAQVATVPLKSALGGPTNADPTDASGGKATKANRYMLDVYLGYILPKKRPDLSLVWFRDPDTTEHAYGPGSTNFHLALQAQDARLGEMMGRLRELGLDTTTNVIVVSDHAHSSVSGPTSLFPLRSIQGGVVGAPSISGFSVSGDVRTADLIARAKLGVTPFDGSGCQSSAMAGTRADGTLVYPVLKDVDGSVCGKAGTSYQTPSYVVPKQLPANAVVVAANGGSDYLYVPSHDPAIVQRLVRFLQERSEYGAVFVAARYGAIAGTLPMADVNVEGSHGRNPDIVVSFDYDENAVVAGYRGTEFESFSGNRGMHGSFSPIDVHNTLLAAGPRFKAGLVSDTPSGNVDVAPTVAWLLGTGMPKADGRILAEALAMPPASAQVLRTEASVLRAPGSVSGLRFRLPTDPDGSAIDTTKTGTYGMQVEVKDVTTASGRFRYFDRAKATRQ